MLVSVLPRRSASSAICVAMDALDLSTSKFLSGFHAPIFAAASCEAGLPEKRRRTTWPFHIQSPERSSTGRKAYRTEKA